jgi:uncharacterized membrane protein YfcA
MSELIFLIVLLLGATSAGLVGALTGLGGGVIMIPLLTLALNVDIKYAIGTSLIASITTSCGAASSFLDKGITNVRIGMFLEIATTCGAIIGALIAIYIPSFVVAIIFGIVLLFSALIGLRKKIENEFPPNIGLGSQLKLSGTYTNENGKHVNYGVTNVFGGFSMMTFAGILSGILGIGSGAVKVLAMDVIMKIPFKVSTTTSNFMVGVTTAAGAVIYLQRGYIHPNIVFPVIIGVFFGSKIGAQLLLKINSNALRVFFSIVISVLAVQMLYNGITRQI